MNYSIGILIVLVLIRANQSFPIEDDFFIDQPSHNSTVYNTRNKHNIFTEITRNIISSNLSHLLHADRIYLSNHFIDGDLRITFYNIFVHPSKDVHESTFDYYFDSKNYEIKLNTKPNSIKISGQYSVVNKHSEEKSDGKFDVLFNHTFAWNSNSSVKFKRKLTKIGIHDSTKYLKEIATKIQIIIEPIIQEIFYEKFLQYQDTFPFLQDSFKSKFNDSMILRFFYIPKTKYRIGPIKINGLNNLQNFKITTYQIVQNNRTRLAYNFTQNDPIFGTFVYFNNTATQYEKNVIEYTINRFTISIMAKNASDSLYDREDINIEFSPIKCSSKNFTKKSLEIICGDFFYKAFKYILSRKVMGNYQSSDDDIYLTPYTTHLTPIGSLGYFE